MDKPRYDAPKHFKTASPDRYELLKSFANENRKNPTEAESFLWHNLKDKNLGVRFRRQYVVGDYIADFICFEKKIVIEVDGAYHFNGIQIIKDSIRSNYIKEMGYDVIRFTNNEIMCEPEQVINEIKNYINNDNVRYK